MHWMKLRPLGEWAEWRIRMNNLQMRPKLVNTVGSSYRKWNIGFLHSFIQHKKKIAWRKLNLNQNVFPAHFFFLKILLINFKKGLQPFWSENACLVLSPVQSIDKIFSSIADRVTYLIHAKLRFFPPLKQDSEVNFLRHLTVKQQASTVKLRTRLN